MIKYQYQVLRYIHDQFTGEFGNLGIILYAPEAKFLCCKVTSRYARLSDFFGDINGQFLINSIRHLETAINKIGTNIDEYLKEHSLEGSPLTAITASILPKDDSALQLTNTFFGLDIDSEIAIESLYERIIERYYSEDQSTPHTDAYAWSKYYKKYFDDYGITKQLKKHSIVTEKDSIDFDKAWKNGVWNCYQPLSLDLKSEDAIKNKVYKWSGIIKALETSKEEIHLYFLTTTPNIHTELSSFINETLTVNEKALSVEVISENNAEDFVKQVRKNMQESNLLNNGIE